MKTKLQTLQLRNFQSHPQTEVVLVDGINAFVGASDQGKTACLRALNWVANNSPSGDAIISDWARTENGTIKEPCSVTVTTTTGHSVTRIKSAKRNGYDVDSQEYNAIKTGVPEEVSKCFNLEAVNWQRQMDPPFLLAVSGGERARFFNSLIRLEEIDKCLSIAESTRRAVNSSIPPLESAVSMALSELELAKALDSLPPLLETLRGLLEEQSSTERITQELRAIRDTIKTSKATVDRMHLVLDTLDTQMETLRDLSTEITQTAMVLGTIHKLSSSAQDAQTITVRLKRLPELDNSVVGLNAMRMTLVELQAKKTGVEDLVATAKSSQAILDRPDGETLLSLCSRYRMQHQAWDSTESKRRQVHILVTQAKETTEEIGNCTLTIETLEASLPEICPMCRGTGKLRHLENNHE